ncbi:MAG TPA: 16S rRNA (guanine(527)-N(7))-methyltransferase RsmG [Geopsychrobacteraceae bacterium]|nr:16S rRNA (guanine(527)-N(7))-methyltransferase RsmG [Geopsychrobacteraceae bacterium]
MRERLKEGLNCFGLTLDEEAHLRLERFLSELLRWNRKVNLTAITAHDVAIEKHLIDSLLLLPLLQNKNTLFDMGSGAGLPGIPLSIARSDLDVLSVDGVGKKISFQRHAKRVLSLQRFTPVHSRLEDVAGKLATGLRFDVVTARAFSSVETIVRLGAPWLSTGGKILAMKGPEGEKEVLGAKKIISEAGLRVEYVHSYSLPFSRSERQVVVLTKEKKTPSTNG